MERMHFFGGTHCTGVRLANGKGGNLGGGDPSTASCTLRQQSLDWAQVASTDALQVAFGREVMHLHRFEIRGREYGLSGEGGLPSKRMPERNPLAVHKHRALLGSVAGEIALPPDAQPLWWMAVGCGARGKPDPVMRGSKPVTRRIDTKGYL
jgi:hypothetical protein